MAKRKTAKKVPVKAGSGAVVGGLFRVSPTYQDADRYGDQIYQCIELVHPYGENNPYGVIVVCLKFEKNKAVDDGMAGFFEAKNVKWLTTQEAEAAKIQFAVENFL